MTTTLLITLTLLITSSCSSLTSSNVAIEKETYSNEQMNRIR